MKAWNYYPIRGGLRLVKLWSMTSKLWSTCSKDLINIFKDEAPQSISYKHTATRLEMACGSPAYIIVVEPEVVRYRLRNLAGQVYLIHPR